MRCRCLRRLPPVAVAFELTEPGEMKPHNAGADPRHSKTFALRFAPFPIMRVATVSGPFR